MRIPHAVAHLVLALIVLAATLLPVTPVDAADDFSVSNGHFFTQTSDQPGLGFTVRDEGLDSFGHLIRFWSEFQRFGGVAALGYPISGAYRDGDGFYYQLFQRALLQWRPEQRAAVLANIFDQMSRNGADQWLATLGIPEPIADDGSKGDFAAAIENRLRLLTQPQIKAAYFAASPGGDPREAMAHYGLPTSLPVRSGPFIVQRFQRVALQLWLDAVPAMPAPGTVVAVLGGDLYRTDQQNRAPAPDQRFIPRPPEAVSGVVVTSTGASSIDAALRPALDLLAAIPSGRRPAAALGTPGVSLGFENVPAIALFDPASLSVSINPEWRGIDPRTMAAVLAHEGSHVADLLSGVNMLSSDGCYQTELDAFRAQASVWRDFYGSQGKNPPTSELDRELNEILDQVQNHSDDFTAHILILYRDECGL